MIEAIETGCSKRAWMGLLDSARRSAELSDSN